MRSLDNGWGIKANITVRNTNRAQVAIATEQMADLRDAIEALDSEMHGLVARAKAAREVEDYDTSNALTATMYAVATMQRSLSREYTQVMKERTEARIKMHAEMLTALDTSLAA